ncbi:MAG TPA: ATP-dependent DNA helicase RecG, partial [Patescibacteria group bacterium]|nr:ATP-dependent DNA helicase RecG [Patescibacteria group bacterium]
KAIKQLMPEIYSLPETLPSWLIKKQDLISRSEATGTIHFPKNAATLQQAKRRLGFEEVFGLTLASLLNKYELMKEHALAIPFEEKLAKDFVKHLPFKLTDDQRRTIWQIYLDIQKEQPMNRLVEGDVGSGKTVVAVMAAVMAVREGFQVALMAPTEILARQHAETIHDLLEPLGLADQLSLLIGSLKPAQKKTAYARIKSGDVRFIVGTHALIQEKVDMHKLGLIIIDEQHRFGVEERKRLQAKAGHAVHILSMTATPIPRSLALTLYGEMELSIIASKPPGRKPIITKLWSPNSRAQLYKKIEEELASGGQMFVVCPTIQESDILPTKSAEEVFKELNQGPFKHRKLGLIHGRMKSEDKETVMRKFVEHEIDILVATTVIEVGVSVPNATVMLIESPERFGLAQIHQLRGRVGRGVRQGYCYLVLSDSKSPSRRLKALESSSDGFKLAEMDLEIRGPGAIYGTFQHGQLDLRIAKLSDVKLISSARRAAQEFIDKQENLLKYKQLNEQVQKLRAITNLN